MQVLNQYIESNFDQNTAKPADTLSEMLEKTTDDVSARKTTLKRAKSPKKVCVKKLKKSRKRTLGKSKRSAGIQESA